MKQITTKLLQNVARYALENNYKTGDGTGMIINAFKLDMAQQSLEPLLSDGNFFEVNHYPDGVNLYPNEIGSCLNFRICVDDSLKGHIKVSGDDGICFEVYLLNNPKDEDHLFIKKADNTITFYAINEPKRTLLPFKYGFKIECCATGLRMHLSELELGTYKSIDFPTENGFEDESALQQLVDLAIAWAENNEQEKEVQKS